MYYIIGSYYELYVYGIVSENGGRGDDGVF